MQNQKLFDDIAEKIRAALPPGVGDLRGEVEKNIRAVLQSAFAKLELVTRDEFEVQTQVLLKTRMKLEALEQQVRQLEEILKVESPLEAVTGEKDHDDKPHQDGAHS